MTVLRSTWDSAQRSFGGNIIGQGWTGQAIPLVGGGRFWAGLADDPFFFDLARFQTFKATLLADGTLDDLARPG